jgi:hypothetical protein
MPQSNPTEFEPVFRHDGTLDPTCIEQAGLGAVKRWLSQRLAGTDPVFPLDKRYDEDPSSLVVSIVRDAGLRHPATVLVAHAIRSFLEQSERQAPNVPAYFADSLHVCQRIRLPETSDWFTAQLASIADAADRTEDRWGGFELTKEIVYAAIVQSPGLPTAASQEHWLNLLKIPWYSTLALGGLATSFEEEAYYLADWWENCPAGERRRELDQMLFTALKTNDQGRVAEILRERRASFSPDLEAAIDLALHEHGAAKVFSTANGRSRSSSGVSDSLAGAGRRRELVIGTN